MSDDPLILFQRWIDDAVAAGVPEADAMALATASRDGVPSVRFVLFRGLSEGGLRFFTNLGSRKGDELTANPRASVVFWWQPLGRQVRLEGKIERLSAAEDDAYFAARPRGHRLAALASPQSQPIGYDQLLDRYAALEREYQDQEVPRPAGWGGLSAVLLGENQNHSLRGVPRLALFSMALTALLPLLVWTIQRRKLVSAGASRVAAR